MPPNPKPIPHFIADTTQEGIPHGRFAERLTTAFREAVDGIQDLPEGAVVEVDGDSGRVTIQSAREASP